MASEISNYKKNLYVIFIIFLIVCISGCMIVRESEMDGVSTRSKIDLSQVPNGTYIGDYQLDDIEYQVEVTVDTHRIKSIKLIHGIQRVFVKKCALCKINSLIKDIINNQSLEVDAISGATQTSWAVINAIKNALPSP